MNIIVHLPVVVQKHLLPSQFTRKTCTWPCSSLIHMRTWQQSCSSDRRDDHWRLAAKTFQASLSIHFLQCPSPLRIHCVGWCCDMVLVLKVYGSCKMVSIIILLLTIHFNPGSDEISCFWCRLIFSSTLNVTYTSVLVEDCKSSPRLSAFEVL